MDFRTFRDLKGWNYDQAATELKSGYPDLGITGSLVRKHEVGLHFPRPELIARYEEISDGAVTYQDWLRTYGTDEAKGLRAEATAQRKAKVPATG